MIKRSRVVLSTCATALVLVTGINSASARRIELSGQRVRLVWEPIVFAGTGGGPRISCPVSMEGSFHSRTISKVSGQLIGYITTAEIAKASCIGASNILALNGIENAPGASSLPWHVRYDSFSGRLPAIAGIKLQVVGFALSNELPELGVTCLYKSSAERPLRGIADVSGEGKVTTLTPTTDTVPKFEGSLLCPGSIEFANSGTVGQPIVVLCPSTTALLVRLIQ